jgi:hypothetical protein
MVPQIVIQSNNSYTLARHANVLSRGERLAVAVPGELI